MASAEGQELIPILIGSCCGMLYLLLHIASVIWAASDASKRGKSGCLVALIVFVLGFPIGLLAWLIFRPRD